MLNTRHSLSKSNTILNIFNRVHLRTMQASIQCTLPISRKLGKLVRHNRYIDHVQQFGSTVYCLGEMSITVEFLFNIKHLRKQSIRKHRHIANNNLTKTFLVVSPSLIA